MKEVEFVGKNLLTKKTPGPGGFLREYCEILQKERISTLHKLLQKGEEEETFPRLCYEVRFTLIPKQTKTFPEKRSTDKDPL